MNTKTIEQTCAAVVAAIDWDRGYFTNEESEAICGFQNPFRVARLRDDLAAIERVLNISTAVFSETARECARLFGDGSRYEKPLEALSIALNYELTHETRKPQIARWHGMKRNGEDEAWRIAVVLSKKGSSLFPTDEACGNLWNAWGFDPSCSPQSDYSPTGRMFQNALCVRRCANGCAILSQSGARDV